MRVQLLGSLRCGTRRRSPALPLAPLLALLLGACAGELANPEAYDDPATCGLDVRDDILVPRCARSNCHRPGNPPAGLEYLTYGLEERLVGMPSVTCPDHLLIDPEDVEASHILVRVSDAPTCGDDNIARMPQIGAPLDEREMACLRAWVYELAGVQQP